jgi:hypothetical protein
MPRISFTQEVGPSKSASSFPKLKLGMGETARVVCLEEPVMAYVHTLEKPQIRNGVAVMETKKRKDGQEYTKNAMKYVSSFLCLGDADVMAERGVDPDNCPACKASTRSDEVKAPKPKYAMNVLRYATRGNQGELASQFNVSVEAWVFSNQQYSQLRKLALEGWKLQEHDLILGPCQDETYQRFEIVLSQQAHWMASEDNKKRSLATFKENKASDDELETLCARKVERKYIEQDLEQVHDAWLQLNGVAAGPVDKILQTTDSVQLPEDSIANFDTPATATTFSKSASVELDFDALMEGL